MRKIAIGMRFRGGNNRINRQLNVRNVPRARAFTPERAELVID